MLTPSHPYRLSFRQVLLPVADANVRLFGSIQERFARLIRLPCPFQYRQTDPLGGTVCLALMNRPSVQQSFCRLRGIANYSVRSDRSKFDLDRLTPLATHDTNSERNPRFNIGGTESFRLFMSECG